MLTNFLLLAADTHEQGFTLHYQLIVGSTALVVGVIVLLALMAFPQFGVVPRGWGAAFEHVFDWIDGMAQDMIGREGRQYVPFLMSLFVFVLFSNWSGLLPWPVVNYTPVGAVVQSHDHEDEAIPHEGIEEEIHDQAHAQNVTFEAPSASYNTTLALALISFFAFNFYGLRKRIFPPKHVHHHHEEAHDHPHHHAPGGILGLGEWIAHFWQPTPMLYRSLDGGMKLLCIPLGLLFICLNIIEEFARILSLSIRLFGNISGEHQVKTSLIATMQMFLTSAFTALTSGSPLFLFWGMVAGLIWMASAFATCLGALAGFIQAMIFAVLSLVYIAHAVADEH